MPVDIAELVLKIQAINSNMREEFMACKHDLNLILQVIGTDFPCSICGKGFTRKGDLKIHMVVHSEDRPYECRIPGCDKSFKTSANRCRHERSCEFLVT